MDRVGRVPGLDLGLDTDALAGLHAAGGNLGVLDVELVAARAAGRPRSTGLRLVLEGEPIVREGVSSRSRTGGH
jgi:hypothetical protein